MRRRVLLALCRFERQLRHVGARFATLQNPLGGCDVRCRVRARLRSGRVLESEAFDSDVDSAVGRAATRLALLAVCALDGRASGRDA